MVKTFRISLLFVLVFSLALSAVAPSAAQDQKVLRAVIGPAGTNVIWDVALATDTTSHTFIEMMFPGLVPREETTGVPEPGMAESWDISEDARTYTFHLKQGVPWVTYDFDADEVVQVTDEAGEVRMVTAHDFVYGALRTMDPETAADYGYLPANWVEGGDAFNTGEGAREDVKIAALTTTRCRSLRRSLLGSCWRSTACGSSRLSRSGPSRKMAMPGRCLATITATAALSSRKTTLARARSS